MNLINSFQRTAIFISGTGSCMQALLELSEYQNISIVVSNKKNILGALKAKRFGIQIIYLDKEFNFEQLDIVLKQKKIQKIFLAGFMKIIPESFIQQWAGRIFNIHPSLLPKHKGLHAFEKSFESGDDMGATIHHVVSELDSGQIIFQKKSSTWDKNQNLANSKIYLQTTEQHILREFAYKGHLSSCIKF